MKFFIYIFLSLSPILFITLHDIAIMLIYDQPFRFVKTGYFIYNYTPWLFFWIRETFIDSAFKEAINTVMNTRLFYVALLTSIALTCRTIYAKINNKGPFRDYLLEIPEVQKKWLKRDLLDSRFSGGKMHITPDTQK